MNVTELKQLGMKHPKVAAASATVEELAEAVHRRMDLMRAQPPAHSLRPSQQLFLAESLSVLEPAMRYIRPPLHLPMAKNPRVVILMPGFGTHPVRMRYMAERLEEAGHTVKRWGAGFNMGANPENFALVAQRVVDLSQRYGQPVMLVGWSLGGIFAREVAKLHPEAVARVITLGSPFSHTPYSNNVWRLYQLITGYSVERPPLALNLAAKPPVETIALWSPRDGVVAARSAAGRPGERDRARALRCSHMGFSNSPEAIRAVAEELDSE